MPILLDKHTIKHRDLVRDVRPLSVRIAESFSKTEVVAGAAIMSTIILFMAPIEPMNAADIICILLYFYFKWAIKKPFSLEFKLPKYADMPDPHNPPPGKTSGGKSDGILFLGNVSDEDSDNYKGELWLTNNDARTHILYIGTTGSGKTEGLKSMVCNSLAWGSGFAYTDGKADTDLWASLYAMARRFGRDDDLLVLNYMTGNSDDGSTSNTMNPFSSGSASYLSNMIVSFMPDAGGDNAMWKERATALMFALMPALTYKRDKQGLLLDVDVVRDYIELGPIIRLSRDTGLPEHVAKALKGYLSTLPGYVDAAFDDEGNERPPSPDQPMYDLQVARQQHGYLSMQFTRSLQSLADEYGYIFKAQLADIDVLDVVLNRRILVVLIPALEKAPDEAANLGKIIVASLKGMMGATLGASVEGTWENAIGTKQTRSSSSFMTVFDEVGYYTAPGMAVMAAQARSLGFSLIFAAQDLPSMEKRIKTEARSIVGNCNLKILGRIEDPLDTKEFVSKHGGGGFTIETSGFSAPTNTVSSLFFNMPFNDTRNTGSIQTRQRVDYDHLRGQREGEAHLIFADWACKAQMFHAVPEKAKALRVHRLMPMPLSTQATMTRERTLNELTARLKTDDWSAATAAPAAKEMPEITALNAGRTSAEQSGRDAVETGIAALVHLATINVGKTAGEKRDLVEVGALPAAKAADKPAAKKAEAPVAQSKPAPKEAKTTEQKPQAQQQQQKPVASTEAVAPMAQAEKTSMRSGLPSFAAGDEFAIEDIEPMQNLKTEAKPEAKTTAKTERVAGEQKAGASIGFAGSEADLIAIIPQSDVVPVGEEINLTLPPEVADLLAKSAKRLSDGLSEGNQGT